MKFILNNEEVVLTGMKACEIQMATKKQLAKLNYTSGKHLFFIMLAEQPALSLGSQVETQDLDTVAQWELQTLFHQYFNLFETPAGLPPQRSHDHAIPLLDEKQVVTVRPYRYLAIQKKKSRG